MMTGLELPVGNVDAFRDPRLESEKVSVYAADYVVTLRLGMGGNRMDVGGSKNMGTRRHDGPDIATGGKGQRNSHERT